MNKSISLIVLLCAMNGCLLFSSSVPCGNDTNCRDGHVCDIAKQECVETAADSVVSQVNDAGIVDGMFLDAGSLDAGSLDAGNHDAGNHDAGSLDAGSLDAGNHDAGNHDAGSLDAGNQDAGHQDAGHQDAGHQDAGNLDGGYPDAGVLDPGILDSGFLDAGILDAGGPDSGEHQPGCLVADFAYSVPITVEHMGASLENYALPINFDTSSLISAGKMSADCSDLQIVDEIGQPQDHFLESGCNSPNTLLWVSITLDTGGGGNLESLVLYLHYGSLIASSQSSGEDTFLFYDNFDDGDPLQVWTEFSDDYQMNHDFGYDVYWASEAVSGSFSLGFLAEASCSTEPFDGVEAYAELTLGLPDKRYCVEFDTRADVTDFLWSSTAAMRSIVFIGGTKILDHPTSCSGENCSEEGDWGTQQIVVESEISTLRLGGRASDCTWGHAFFDNVRVRECLQQEPNSSFGVEASCP